MGPELTAAALVGCVSHFVFIQTTQILNDLMCVTVIAAASLTPEGAQ